LSAAGETALRDTFGIVVALHLFGVIFWIGGLLMLTSLLSRVPEEVGLSKERLLGAIRRLFEVAVNLGAAITIGLGIVLIAMRPNLLRQGWLHAKLLLVAVILFYHVRFYRRIRFLQDNPGESSAREFRVVHAVVSLLTLAILMLAVLRPF
jgi:putative membrane protein